jgi:ankyrin repeat protein
MAMLIAANANVNAADEGGDTPLHCAAQVGFSDCVSLLAQRWCECMHETSCRTPLHVVTER